MRMHIGQPGQQESSLTGNLFGTWWNSNGSGVSDRHDYSPAYDNGLVFEQPFLVHRND
jgi:hypothetical protein